MLPFEETGRPPSYLHRVGVLTLVIMAGMVVGRASVSRGPLLMLLAALPVVSVMLWRPYLQLFTLVLLSVWWKPLASVAGLDATAFDLVLAMTWAFTVSLWLFRDARPRGGAVTYVSREVAWLILLALAAGIMGSIGAALSGGSEAFMKSVALYLKRWGEYSILPLAGVLFLTEKRSRELWRLMLLAGTVVALISVASPGYLGRATSLFFNPNVFGLLCVIVTNMAAACLLVGSDKALGALAGAAGLLGVAASGSRSAGMALVASGLYWLWVFRSRLFAWHRIKYVVLLIGLSPLALLVGGEFLQVSGQRWQSLFAQGMGSGSVLFRLDAWRVGLRMAADRWACGYGIGQVAAYGTSYVSQYARFIQTTIATTDNQYIDILLESGVIGLTVAAAMFLLVWGIAGRGGKAPAAPSARMAGITLRSVLVGFVAAGITVPSFASPFTSSWIWLLATLAVAGGGQRPDDMARTGSLGRNVSYEPGVLNG